MFSKAPTISYGKPITATVKETNKINYVDIIRNVNSIDDIKIINLTEEFEAFGETNPKLFPYQSLVVKAMMDLEQKARMQYLENNALVTVDSCFGILADKLGSGKTYSIMTVIKYSKILPAKRESNLNFQGNMRRTVISKSLKPTLFFVLSTVFDERVNQLNLFNLRYKTIKTAKELNDFYHLVVSGNKLDDYDVILFNTSNLTSKNVPKQFSDKFRSTDTSINKFAIMFKGFSWNRVVVDDIDDFEKKDLELAEIIPAKFTWIISATIERFYSKYNVPKAQQNKNLYSYMYLDSPIMRLFTIKCNDKFIEEQNDLPFIKTYLYPMNRYSTEKQTEYNKKNINILEIMQIYLDEYYNFSISTMPKIMFSNFNQGYYKIDCIPEAVQTDSIMTILSVIFFVYEKLVAKIHIILDILVECKANRPFSKKKQFHNIDVILQKAKQLDYQYFATIVYSDVIASAEEWVRLKLLNIVKLMQEIKSSDICISHCLNVGKCDKNHESECNIIRFPKVVSVKDAPYEFFIDEQKITNLDNGFTHTLQNVLKRIIKNNEKGELIELATNVSDKLFCGTQDCEYNPKRSFLIYVENDNFLKSLQEILTDMGKSHVKSTKHTTKSKKIQSDFKEGKIDFVLFNGKKPVSGMEFQTASDVIFIGAYKNTYFNSGKMSQMLGRCVRIGNIYNTQVHIIASKNSSCSTF